jgi:hypothetical protein
MTAVARGLGKAQLNPGFWCKKETPNDQQDYSAHDSPNQPCPFPSFIPTDSLAEIGRQKRPDNPEDGRENEALRLVGTRMQEFGDDTGYETDDDGPEDVPHGRSCSFRSGEKKSLLFLADRILKHGGSGFFDNRRHQP